MTRYRTIVADPPWEMPESGKWTGSAGHTSRANRRGNWAERNGDTSKLPYASLSLEEIAARPVSSLAEKDAHLYVWTVNRHLEATFGIVRAWGFKPSTLLTWCKAPMGLGMGGAFTQTTEFVIFARRGSLPHTSRQDSSWWQWKRGQHSAKPDAFIDLVEQVSPGPYVELFARRARFGWDYYGDESLGTADLASDGKAA